MFVDVDVPDFAKDPLSASGLILQRKPATPIGDKVIADLVPDHADHSSAVSPVRQGGCFVRIYQGGKGRLVPVRMIGEGEERQQCDASNHESMLEVENFSAVALRGLRGVAAAGAPVSGSVSAGSRRAVGCASCDENRAV